MSCLCSTTQGTDRITMAVKIAGQPALFGLDTGSEATLLLDAGARRLGLEVERPPGSARATPGSVVVGRTERCRIEIGANADLVRLPVVDVPDYLEPRVDGLIGWDILQQVVVVIDTPRKRISMQGDLPAEVSEWSSWRIRPGATRLIVEIPSTGPTPETLMIDTGSPSGVELAPQRWQRWSAAHPNLPATLNSAFIPGVGIVATEERWAPVFDLDGLMFQEIPVGRYGALVQHAPEDRHVATLGLCALRRASWVIDGRNGRLYFQSHGPPQGPNNYEYNRLGAVFIPRADQGDELLAQVFEGGPAYRAGIRTGDILLRINDLDAAAWRTDPRIQRPGKFWSSPAGTVLHLGLQRQDKTFDATIILEDIFPARLGD
jgi:hypothetical protein